MLVTILKYILIDIEKRTGIIFRPDFWILGHRDLAPYSPTCMRPCLTLPRSSWFRSEQWNVANSGRERREWKLGGSKSGRIPPLAVWERTVWSLHIGWGGLAFSHLGKQLPSLQSCTLVFNNTIAGTIARAALEGWELRHWHVGAFQAFPPAREYLPLYCHSHTTATEPLFKLERWKCHLDFLFHLLTGWEWRLCGSKGCQGGWFRWRPGETWAQPAQPAWRGSR